MKCQPCNGTGLVPRPSWPGQEEIGAGFIETEPCSWCGGNGKREARRAYDGQVAAREDRHKLDRLQRILGLLTSGYPAESDTDALARLRAAESEALKLYWFES